MLAEQMSWAKGAACEFCRRKLQWRLQRLRVWGRHFNLIVGELVRKQSRCGLGRVYDLEAWEPLFLIETCAAKAEWIFVEGVGCGVRVAHLAALLLRGGRSNSHASLGTYHGGRLRHRLCLRGRLWGWQLWL